MPKHFIQTYDQPEKCEQCDREEEFHGSCFVTECRACFHSIDEVLGHFAREVDELHQKYSPSKTMTLNELNQILECTIKKDDVSKAIIFLGMILVVCRITEHLTYFVRPKS